MIGTGVRIWQKRSILAYFIQNLLITSYRTKSLGFLWALLDPLFFMCVYYIVFAVIIAHRTPSFMLHIFTGVIAFRFLSTSLSQSSQIVKSQGGLIREIAFPKTVLPVAVVATRLFDFAAGWMVAVALAFIFHKHPTFLWLLIPPLIFIQAMLVLGLSFITAYIGVFFADIQNILDFGLRFWFYMSPILYELADIKKRAVKAEMPQLYHLYLLNPFAGLIQSYSDIVAGRMPHYINVVYPAVAALIILLLGTRLFSRAEGQFSKYV